MSDAAVAWRRVSRGVTLAGIGVFLLLTTLGLLRASFWLDAVSYWPMVLVALGIRLIFDRSRAPWAILLSPLILIGTLAWVAARAPASEGEAGDWADLRIERPEEAGAWTLEGTVALARLRIGAAPLPDGLLVQGRSRPTRHGGVRLSRAEGKDRVHIGNSWQGAPFVIFPGPSGICDLDVTPDLPVTLDLDLALTQGKIDLANAPVERVALDGAFNVLRLHLGAPASEVHLEFNGSFNQIELYVPPSTPVATVSEGFINIVNGRRNAPVLKGPGYHVRLAGAFNHVAVRSS